MHKTTRITVATIAGLLACCLLTGCWAPLHSHGIAASSLPDHYRTPFRTAGFPLNYSELTVDPPADYLLGPGDILDVTVPGLFDKSEVNPLKAEVMSNGEIHLPLVGAVKVEGMNVVGAQQAINKAYANGFLREPRVNTAIFQKATVNVLVLGNVNVPGTYVLPKYENDVGHAIAAAQGLTEDAADLVEVHRRAVQTDQPVSYRPFRLPPAPGEATMPTPCCSVPSHCLPGDIVTLPLRGPNTRPIDPSEIVLQSGDVIVVPSRRHEVFYVVGKLKETNAVRFNVGNRDRELGVGFILPRDREIDVVTAVAMAGYIDPIDSPTTVTVHRVMPDGEPMLIHVDLIAARYDRVENVLVEPGDIIYLNPDAHWWFRRTFDRVVPDLIRIPYEDIFFD